ncbi:hypothetical protein [Sorangium sp. So ce854]|uniref:hypothetical protein n=1 Tax=Sorangium sp. So ce854 TaxID=3133322 RepID=UPI003F61BE8D
MRALSEQGGGGGEAHSALCSGASASPPPRSAGPARRSSSLVSSTVPFCVVTPPGVGLGSKSAAVVAVEPGGCAPQGGEPVGELHPAGPSTYCCIA